MEVAKWSFLSKCQKFKHDYAKNIINELKNSNPSQWYSHQTVTPLNMATQKGVSIQHYLIKMLDRILTALDTNNQYEKYAVIVQLVDWAQAFDRQCPQLGIQSFLNNGVRKSVIPVLISYFQNIKMKVKLHNKLSSLRISWAQASGLERGTT